MADTSSTGIERKIEDSIGAFDGIAPSTSASKRSRKPCYDVFINHRGPDVKQTLAKVLYGILTGIHLSVFLDSEESEYGDLLPRTIEAAMTSALIHIAIFSKSYAESPWCLAELSFMLKSRATIIPIFYHVDPTDLRWVDQGKGIYVNAFEEHERKGRYSKEKLQEWKTALHNVSFYHGQIINCDEDEARLLKNIVSCVMKEKSSNMPFVVAKHPVGLKEIVEDFKVNTLRSADDNQDAQIVGIWGMGGSGKTTLVKELYNEISFSMEKSSFVFEVRDAATKGQLYKKQRKLLKDLGAQDQDLEFDNIEEGMRILSRVFKSNRVLVVLDDVDSEAQLDTLLPTLDCLRRGSLIIVTTRACNILKSWGISFIYTMRQLDPLYAMELFCWHAFLKSDPPDEFKELVEKFLMICNGLPLSLKVFGAQLYGELRKEYWESQLHKISRILPNNIKQRLKISYDTLDNEEKEIFLDAACFFIGEECSLAIEVWNGLGLSGLHSWERLMHKCLVELDNQNHIRMHDHLRDLGRDIAHKKSPYRIWFPQQTINVQKKRKKTICIRGIIATSSQVEWKTYYEKIERPLPEMATKAGAVDEFSNNEAILSVARSLDGLNFLVISGDYLNQVMGKVSRELVWLRWFQIGRRNLPSEISLKNLRVLELYEGNEHHLEKLWGETDGEVPVQLRQLLLSNCSNFKGFPKSIGHLNHLKKLEVISGRNFTSLPDEFCLLQSLEHLVLNKCDIVSLPDDFGNLRNLRHLSLCSCTRLRRLPVSFRNLMLLEHLNLYWCFQLKFTSEDLNFLENITKLKFLNLSWCDELKELPRHITNQAFLRELYLKCRSLRELPDNIGQLSRLREMKIENTLLTSLPTSFGDLSSLTNLEIKRCSKLERLPDSLGNLSSLTNLWIGWCDKLERLPDSLGDLSSLTNLSIQWCDKLEREGVKSLPKSIRQLNNLQDLSLYDCPISELDFGAASLSFGLISLKNIDLGGTEVRRISFSEVCCPHLETLSLSANHHLDEIEALPKALKSIYVDGSEMLKNIPSFAGFTSLKDFQLRDYNGNQKIEGLETCTRLEILTLKTCWELPGVASLENMQNLKQMELIANNGSVIGRCIRTIQKWPDKVIICARAVPDAASLVHCLLSPNVMILGCISNQIFNFSTQLVLKSPSNGDAFMFCFVINCVSSQMRLTIGVHTWHHISVEVKKGKWACIAFFTQRSGCLAKEVKTAEKFEIRAFRRSEEEECGDEVEKGLVIRGEQQTLEKAVRSLLPIFVSQS